MVREYSEAAPLLDSTGEQAPAAVSDDPAFVDGPFASLYDELRRLAHAQLWRGGKSPTLNTTAVVHEAYLKLSAAEPRWNDRTHFLAVAARVMRQVVIDYARSQGASKRGGDLLRVTMTDHAPQPLASLDDLLAIDRGMELLERTDERLARLVEMRFFAGLTNAEIAGVLALSERSVERDWRRARAFLLASVGDGGAA
jgi:RNA polymerase sigma factor (TIGR02999 family)